MSKLGFRLGNQVIVVNNFQDRELTTFR